jgi:hypothetical protein
MADTNPNSNSQQKPQNDPQKTGLSWSQPVNTTQQNKPSQNRTTDTTPASNDADSSGRVVSIVVGIVIVFALVAWGIAALHNHSGSSEMSMATSTDTGTDTGSTTSQTPANDGGMSTPVTSDTAPSSTISSTSMMKGTNATFAAPTPQDAGTAVSIDNLNISQPTWIIVYESTGGAPGNILGAGLFFPGDTSGTVQLLRATTSGQTYFVTAAVDNGDKIFSAKDEQPVVDSTGKQVWITIQTN